MRLLLLQEKYLELLESGREIEALHCLRHELALVPLHHSDKQLQVLTSYMMYSDKAMLRKAAGWPGLRGGAREQLMDKLQGNYNRRYSVHRQKWYCRWNPLYFTP